MLVWWCPMRKKICWHAEPGCICSRGRKLPICGPDGHISLFVGHCSHRPPFEQNTVFATREKLTHQVTVGRGLPTPQELETWNICRKRHIYRWLRGPVHLLVATMTHNATRTTNEAQVTDTGWWTRITRTYPRCRKEAGHSRSSTRFSHSGFVWLLCCDCWCHQLCHAKWSYNPSNCHQISMNSPWIMCPELGRVRTKTPVRK